MGAAVCGARHWGKSGESALLSAQASEGGKTMTMIRSRCEEVAQLDKGITGEGGEEMCLQCHQEGASVISTLLLGTLRQDVAR